MKDDDQNRRSSGSPWAQPGSQENGASGDKPVRSSVWSRIPAWGWVVILMSVLTAGLMIFAPTPSGSDGRMVRYGIILMILLMGARGLRSLTASQAVKMLMGWGVILGGIAAVYMVFGAPGSHVRPSAAISRTEGSEFLVRRNMDGHFWMTVEIDDVPITLMVDTGATHTVLTSEDARKLGVTYGEDGLVSSARTANGTVELAMIGRRAMSINGDHIGNVPISVAGEGLSTSLLGMSALSKFGSVEIKEDRLILRP